MLTDVMAGLQEVHKTASSLDERKRQMSKAEERLAKAEALLVDLRSSLETLQAQKTIVEQAVEKTGSLKVLVRQAEAMIEGWRDERDMTARVRSSVAEASENDFDDRNLGRLPDRRRRGDEQRRRLIRRRRGDEERPLQA
jgi:hypothetical protein